MATWTAEQIRDLRKRLGLSKAKLGALVGVTKNYIYYLEKGEKAPSKTLCIVFDCVEKQYQEKEKGGGNG